MNLEERIRLLLAHLGIARVHVVGGSLVDDSIELCATGPDLAASLTLVCPTTVPKSLAKDLAMPLCVVSGDSGKAATMIDGVLAEAPQCHRVVLDDYEALLWSDIAAERTDEVCGALLDFFARSDLVNVVPPVAPTPVAGSIAELHYRLDGEGPPVVLFPLGLAPSQWQPLIDQLRCHHAVLLISGAHTQPTSNLEARASNPGYQAIVGSVIDRIRLAPGERLLEVGCGCGAVSRFLAERTDRANPITGADVNRFLLDEAALLRDEAGLGPVIDFKEGDAHALPFADASFDGTISITMLEEVDAERALAEMVRVTKPGSQVGVAVRALDIEPIIGAELPEPILAKVRKSLEPFGAGPKGCGDASLYRRMVAAGLTDVMVAPQFNSLGHLQPIVHRFVHAGLDPAELEVWTEAVAAAGEAFFISRPMHAAVGTRPA